MSSSSSPTPLLPPSSLSDLSLPTSLATSSSPVLHTSSGIASVPTAVSWRPNEQGTNQVIDLLRRAQNAKDNAEHQRIYRKLDEMRSHPEFNNYLAHIMCSRTNESDRIRGSAALMLKNNVRGEYERMHPLVREYIKQHALSCISDTVPFIRQAAGSLVSCIAFQGKLCGWPTLLRHLACLLDTPSSTQCDGALDALCKVVEECTDELIDESESLGNPLDYLIPLLVRFFTHQVESFRQRSLQALIEFIKRMPLVLVKHMDTVLQNLFLLTQDQSTGVRKEVCHALCILLGVRINGLLPFMPAVIDFMLCASADDDESVCLEACEFWASYCSAPGADLELLKSYLPRLLPILLDSMEYSDLDMTLLACEDDDEHIPDRPEDIRPRFHASRHATNVVSGDTDESEADWDDEDDVSEWNVRKCSASALDKVSLTYRDLILSTLFPLLQQRLSDMANWKRREASILALGAIALGCLQGLSPHLPDLIPYLIALLVDTHPLIRSITCWTLSRFSAWILSQNGDDQYFKPLMEALLGRVLDRNKKVQETACSAFATLEDEAHLRLVPYLGPILHNLMFAFDKYQAKNKLILYDALGTLAERVGGHLAQPEFISVIMTPLLRELEIIRNNDRNIFPLLECLTYVSQALGVTFTPFAPVVFTRCLTIIEQHMHAQQVAAQTTPCGVLGESIDREFTVCALDLLSGICEGLESDVESLISGSNLFALMYVCINDFDADVRQSAIALLGDTAKFAVAPLRPHFDKFVAAAVDNLVPANVAVCNNASWALGEIAIKAGANFHQFVPSVVMKMSPMLNSLDIEPRLVENVSITLGRIALVCPEAVGPFLPQFIRPWCYYLSRYQEDNEKAHAFKGLCFVCQANPQACLAVFSDLCNSIALWRNPPQDLSTMFGQLLHGFKSSLAAQNQWSAVFDTCSQDIQAHLLQLYRL